MRRKRPRQQKCPHCVKLEAKIAQQEAKIAQQEAGLAKAEKRLASVEAELAKAKKNSSNSSKPPSSDIVQPPPKSPKGGRGKDKKRKRGGQPGHPRHQRTAFPPEQVDVTWVHHYTGCPCCGGRLVDTGEPAKVMQQVEIERVPVRVEEHQRRTQCCTQCGKSHLVWPVRKKMSHGLAEQFCDATSKEDAAHQFRSLGHGL